MSIYSEIKAQISTRDVAEYYGFKVTGNGMTCCPFHDDKAPSMKVDKNFICFGCNEKGDVIRFAAKLFNLSEYNAARKLAEDMNLSVDTDRKSHRKKTVRNRKKRKNRKDLLFEKAVNRIFHTYCSYYHQLNEWAEEYAPDNADEDLHPFFVEAAHKKAGTEYLLDTLLSGSMEDKAEVVIEKGKEVDKIERRIKEYKRSNRERSSRGPGCDGTGYDG